jgi:hypothetical protein
MTWEPGRQRIGELVTAGELARVQADEAVALRLLADARMHLASARDVAAAGDLAGAYELAYDAFRKSAPARAQQLRVPRYWNAWPVTS